MFTSCKMASRIFLLCLIVSCLNVKYIECRGGRGGGGGGSRSSGSFGGSRSSGSRSSWGSRSSYSKSSSSWGSSSSSHSYPLSSGLSGSRTSSHSYPPSSGLSGSSRGSSTVHSSSSTGLSGFHSAYGKNYYFKQGVPVYVPSYYNSPQHVYVHDYRHSDSRYGDLLTGLTLYNLGRSQSNYHDHYYYDDFYRRRYNTPSHSTTYVTPVYKPKDEATCLLRVKEKGREDTLKIPCEIVSTFTQGSKNVTPAIDLKVNKIVCTTTTTVVNNTVSVPVLENNRLPDSMSGTMSNLSTVAVHTLNSLNATISALLNNTVTLTNNTAVINGSLVNPILPTMLNSSVSPHIIRNGSLVNVTVPTTINSTSTANMTTTTNVTTMNVTTCITDTSAIDPLTVKGTPPANVTNIECVVEIHTKDTILRNNVDCGILIVHSEMFGPKNDTGILPSRSKLKSWLLNPPWWMSLLIAV